MAYPTVMLLNLLLILLTTSHSSQRLDCRTKEETTQKCGNKAKSYQIPFHARTFLTAAKVVQNERRAKFSFEFYFPNLACTTLTT